MISRLPRFIKPETIVLGDMIRVSSKCDGIEFARTGIADTREHEGASTVYRTPEGGELLRWIPENARAFTVTLLQPSERRVPKPPALFHM